MVDFTDKPGYSFRQDPPPEVAAYFRGKGDRLSFAWEDVEPEEHAVAFTVAKAMQADVLDAIRTEVDRAIEEGRTLDQFRRDLKPRLAALGWWGRAEMEDPDTGELREVQLGSPRRLRTIYRANMRAARAAGQWDRIQRTKAALPYLLYLLGPSERHRPDHAAKAGMVLAADDPFWSAWMPPNGWGCKCHVRQIGRAEAERRGIAEAPRIEQVEWTNPRTGETRLVDRGLDPAWSANPGRVRQRNAERFLDGKIAAMSDELVRVATADISRSWAMRRVAAGASGAVLPIARTASQEIVRIEPEIAQKIATKHRDVAADLHRVHEILATAPLLRRPDGSLVAVAIADGMAPAVVIVHPDVSRGGYRLGTYLRPRNGAWVMNRFSDLPVVRGEGPFRAWAAQVLNRRPR